MRVLLAGTAAGGGFPQWNCACPRCTAPGLPHRTQDSLAVSPDGRGWYLLNASPDVRAQVLTHPPLAAGPGPRETPLRGVLLTDAELDHTLGLLLLREGGGLRVWATEPVLGALAAEFPVRSLVSRYGDWRWSAVAPGEPWELGEPGGRRLEVTALPVSAKRPKYAAAAEPAADAPWVVAYRLRDPVTGGVLVYAPCLARWPEGFDALVADADCVVLDGTFHSAHELPGATADAVGGGAQRAMGHLPMVGPDGTLDRVRRARPATRWLYTHLNNTNPVVDPGSAEHAEVRAAGAEAPPDGTEFEL